MKKWFTLSALLLISFFQSSGQQTQSSNNTRVDNSVLNGHFNVDRENKQKGVTEHINVNYAISTLPLTTELSLALRTPEPMMLTASIVDVNGKSIIHWQPSSISSSYTGTINIAQLKPGNYKLEIFAGEGPVAVYSVSFQKVQGK